jgi:hypothetical protein
VRGGEETDQVVRVGIARADLEEAAWLHGRSLEEVGSARLERNGRISAT